MDDVDLRASAAVPADHPDRVRWNTKYERAIASGFPPHPLVVRLLTLDIPPGPVADIACGLSGSSLALAEAGYQVTAIDVSDIALARLREEAVRRGLSGKIDCVQVDLCQWHPPPPRYSLLFCSYFWSARVFQIACRAVRPGGLLAWEAPVYTPDAPAHVRKAWCLVEDEPVSLLPAGFSVIERVDVEHGPEIARRVIARAGP